MAQNHKAIPYVLTERDLTLLSSVYKYRYLSGSQVQKLLFPSQRTADRRIQLLIAGDYLKSFRVPGIFERIISLTAQGAELVEVNMATPDNSIFQWNPKNSVPKDYYFLKHFLAVNDFRINLDLACGHSEMVELVGFLPEYYAKRSEKGGMEKYIKDFVCDIKNPEEKVSHTPDGVFALRHKQKGTEALLFLEIDRGTEGISNLEKGVLKCLHFYLNYLLQGGYKKYAKEFYCQEFRAFRVLFVTTSQERVNNIRKAAQKTEQTERMQKAKKFIWLSSFDRISPESFFKEIWNSLEISDSEIYGLIG